MDLGWDIPQSGSGAGSIDQESSFYQDSSEWDPSNPSNAWDNSCEHEIFWDLRVQLRTEDTILASVPPQVQARGWRAGQQPVPLQVRPPGAGAGAAAARVQWRQLPEARHQAVI